MKIEAFLHNLINIASLTDHEAEHGNHLISQLTAFGLDAKLFPVHNDRANIYVGSSLSPHIILSTHYDTVPPFIPARLDTDTIFGRGACDAKGSLAAMVFAYRELPQEVQKRAGLLFVVGEETDSSGAIAAVKHGLRAKYVINGEPTGNVLVRAQKGVFIFELTAKGRAAHSGYPQHGDSAIERLLNQLQVLRGLHWGSHKIFGDATLNIGTISGGAAANVIADAATAQCCLRVVTSCTDAEKLLQKRLLVGVDYRVLTASAPLELYVPPGFENIVVQFGSDAAYLAKIGTVLMAGPGDILQAHTPTESIAVAELNEAVALYKRLVFQLLD